MNSVKNFHACRRSTTGQPHGPSLYHLLEVLGKDKTLARIERVLSLKGF